MFFERASAFEGFRRKVTVCDVVDADSDQCGSDEDPTKSQLPGNAIANGRRVWGGAGEHPSYRWGIKPGRQLRGAGTRENSQDDAEYTAAANSDSNRNATFPRLFLKRDLRETGYLAGGDERAIVPRSSGLAEVLVHKSEGTGASSTRGMKVCGCRKS